MAMQAYEYIRFGGSEVLRLVGRDDPIAGPDDVVVDMRAVGVNPVDLLQRAGAFRFAGPTRFPVVPGNELSGIVSAVGTRVDSFSVGDAVFARTDKARLGALAERVAIESDLVAPMPRTLDFTTAAAVPLAGTTALQAVRDALAVRPGERMLITGGSSMVGMFAIQLAHRAGAHIVTTASAASEPLLLRLGADEVVDYRSRAVDAGAGKFDKVFDLVPGTDLLALLALTRRGGRLVSVAATPTPGSIRKDYTMTPWRASFIESVLWLATLRTRRGARRYGVTYQRLSMRPDGHDLRELGRLIDAGALEVRIDSVFPFDRAAEAFSRVETRRARGKVVVTSDMTERR
ncbi:NADP-dependent oxidoreductase [Streptosporangium sp. NPDC000563]|uniref:NADP-dependent oxidoreductase n=1 Tax=Streptosporangium sp. NPDC000563 TaxID=3154366 RepID=UPI0033233DF9